MTTASGSGSPLATPCWNSPSTAACYSAVEALAMRSLRMSLHALRPACEAVHADVRLSQHWIRPEHVPSPVSLLARSSEARTQASRRVAQNWSAPPTIGSTQRRVAGSVATAGAVRIDGGGLGKPEWPSAFEWATELRPGPSFRPGTALRIQLGTTPGMPPRRSARVAREPGLYPAAALGFGALEAAHPFTRCSCVTCVASADIRCLVAKNPKLLEASGRRRWSSGRHSRARAGR